MTVPEEAINKLIEIGPQVVDYLLPLLEHPNRYSCAYAVEILEATGDKRAMESLVKLEVDEDFADLVEYFEYFKRPIYSVKLDSALEKMGPDVIEPLLRLAEKVPNHYWLPEVIAKIGSKFHDENAFQFVLKHIQQSSSSSYFDVSGLAEALRKFRDKRAIPHLVQLIGKEGVVGKDTVLDALQELCDLETYRDILKDHAKDTVDIPRKLIASSIKELEDAHNHQIRYEGDRSQEWGSYARERRIRESIEALIRNSATLGKAEKAISEEEKKALISVADKIEREIYELAQFFGLPSSIADTVGSKHYPLGKHREEKEYRAIDKVRDRIIASTVQWLRLGDFKTLVNNQFEVWGWKEDEKSKIKGVYMQILSMVRVQDWGEGWTEDEAKSFLRELLTIVDRAATKK